MGQLKDDHAGKRGNAALPTPHRQLAAGGAPGQNSHLMSAAHFSLVAHPSGESLDDEDGRHMQSISVSTYC